MSFSILVPRGICLEVVVLLGHMVVLLLFYIIFLRNFLTVFLSSYINLHFYQQCKRVHFSSYLLWHLFVDFLMMVILTSVRWYFTVALMCISLIMINIEHLFMCLLTIYMSYLEKCLFRSFSHLLIGLFDFMVSSCVSCLYILEINPLSVV